MTNHPDINALRNAIRYDPDSGGFFWLITSRRVKAGDRADRMCPKGYRRIRFQYRDLAAHRVAWALMTGSWPSSDIDHRNTARDDNRWVNLRLATASENGANTHARGSLPKGVAIHRRTGKFQAQIKRAGKSHYIGLFETASAAHVAYLAKAVEFFGEFARAS